MKLGAPVALFAILGLAPLAQAAVTPGDYIRTVRFGGVERNYRLHVPPGYDGSRDVPLVVNLHGLTSAGAQQESISGILPVSDAAGFIVAHPDGINNAWNGGICCGNANVDDVSFLRTVVADIGAQARIDARRVYATGLSNGGAMSHRLGCEAADLFAAVAPLAFPISIAPISACQPSRPIPILVGMGLTDALVSYDGLGFPSAATTFARWKEINGCTGTAPDDTQVFGASRCETYTQCSAGTETRLCSITADSFGGAIFDGHILYLNPDIELSRAVWDFLSRFELPETSTPLPLRGLVNGVAKVRTGRTRGKTPIAWTVSLTPAAWTIADGAGHVYGGPTRRLGKRRTLELALSDAGRAIMAQQVSRNLSTLGATATDVSIDPRNTLRLETDRAGVPAKLKGMLRFRVGGSAGRLLIAAKR